MVSDFKGKLSISKIDLCGGSEKKVKTHSMFCVKCIKWTHGRCTKWRKVASLLVEGFAAKDVKC